MSIFNRKKITDFLIYGFGQFINLASPLLVMPFIIIMCGEEGLGKIGVGFSFALILSGIIDYGSYINGVKEISINRNNKSILEKKLKAIYLSKLILIITVFIVVAVLIFFIPFLAKDKNLFFFSLTIVIGQFINPQWFFQGVENYKWISAVNVISKVLYVALVFLFVKNESDYVYVNLFFGCSAILGNGIGLIWLINSYSFNFSNFSMADAIAIIREEFTFSISQFFLSIYQFSPIILISYIGGDFMAGQFRIIDQIITIFKTYLNMFFYFVYANVCYELNSNFKKGMKVWKQYNGYNFIVLFILLSMFFIFSDAILLYFKIDNQSIATMSVFFRVGLIVPLLVAISQPLRQLMFAFNENRIYINITIIFTILNIVALYFLTKSYGLFGAFSSIIIIELATIVSYLHVLKNRLKKTNI